MEHHSGSSLESLSLPTLIQEKKKKKGLYSLQIVETFLCYQYIFLFAHCYLNGYMEFSNVGWFWQENLDDWEVILFVFLWTLKLFKNKYN